MNWNDKSLFDGRVKEKAVLTETIMKNQNKQKKKLAKDLENCKRRKKIILFPKLMAD